MNKIDTSQEACAFLESAIRHYPSDWARFVEAADLILALRAELDQALRQNRMLCAEMRSECADASATGYARGVRDAAEVCLSRAKANHYNGMPNGSMLNDAAAILALLQEDEWVPIPYNPGDPQPRISDGVYRGIRIDGRGGFEGVLYKTKKTNDAE